ncbi:hypothetical protein FISHEDRAFT_77880 [Fistulina hepatica ATCC 64428]|nr:hypothetical protein FISHEDRAFT_77880 [Fistulina hepatica ATCC 64428]
MKAYHVVVLGAGGVGKSALTVRYMRNVFIENYDPTIEEEYRRSVTVDGQISALEVLDTAGAEQFTSLNEVYMKSGQGFVLVFSLTQEASLREVDNLRQQIYRVKGGDVNTPIIVVGTKMDLADEREVDGEALHRLASRWGLPIYETSSKKGWNVPDVFEDLLRQMRLRYPLEAEPSRKKSLLKCRIM